MTDSDRKIPNLEAIEGHETGQWLKEQLDRIEQLVRDNGGDDEMLEAISFLREENDQWAEPDVQSLAQSEKLSLTGGSNPSH